jgi:hypothetical protein
MSIACRENSEVHSVHSEGWRTTLHTLFIEDNFLPLRHITLPLLLHTARKKSLEKCEYVNFQLSQDAALG